MAGSGGPRARRNFLGGLVSLGAAGLLGCGDRGAGSIGSRFPDFLASDIDGREQRLADYAGLPLVVNFWATWCPPCRQEMPELDAVFRRDGPRGLRVLAFSVDDGPEPVREFRLRVPVSFPLILDRDTRLAERIGVRSFPTTFLVGRDGRIREALVAPRAWLDYPGIQALL